MADRKKTLGRGLEALLDDNSSGGGVMTLRIAQITPNRTQPRKDFDAAQLAELTESISQHGVITPIIVCETATGYTIVAGERRWRAARQAGLTEIPAIIRDYNPRQIAEISLIENLQRADLNPIEEAAGYKALIDGYELTQEQVAECVGKSRSAVANALRLLSLPEGVQTLLRNGNLSVGHAKVLAGIDNAAEAENLAKQAADGAMTVRELEKAAAKPVKKAAKRSRKARDAFYDEFEIAVKGDLGRSVKIEKEPAKNRPGKLTVEFYSKEDLTSLAKMLTQKGE